jgi:Arc/MetJ family transcription regulator
MTPRGSKTGAFTGIDLPWCDIALPFERPLFTPKAAVTIDDLLCAAAADELDVDELFSQHFVDAARIVQHIEATLLDLGQVSLSELCERMPVQNGLAEVVTYLQLGHERFDVVVDDTVRDTVEWRSDGRSRSMSLPRVVFVA